MADSPKDKRNRPSKPPEVAKSFGFDSKSFSSSAAHEPKMLTAGEYSVYRERFVSSSLLKDIFEMPVEVSAISSEEDFYEPNGLSLKEVFAERKRMLAEKRIDVRPVEEFAILDRLRMSDVLSCRPVRLKLSFKP